MAATTNNGRRVRRPGRRLIGGRENIGLAGIELALHALNDPVAGCGTQCALQRRDQQMRTVGAHAAAAGGIEGSDLVPIAAAPLHGADLDGPFTKEHRRIVARTRYCARGLEQQQAVVGLRRNDDLGRIEGHFRLRGRPPGLRRPGSIVDLPGLRQPAIGR